MSSLQSLQNSLTGKEHRCGILMGKRRGQEEDALNFSCRKSLINSFTEKITNLQTYEKRVIGIQELASLGAEITVGEI
jgi:hypothetical protein